MTTTRISHTGHNHPSTTAARTACRKAMKATPAAVPTTRLVAVGNGKATHVGEVGIDGDIYGVRCGAGYGRGVRKNSPIRDLGVHPITDITCRGCSHKYGMAHG
jgi:hypothetical protein